MPISVDESGGIRRIRLLLQKVSDGSMRALAQELAAALSRELATTWGGNIGRGLTYVSEPRRTSAGGWMVGVGSTEILHRDPAPRGTISAFLEWYRTEAQQRKEERARRLSVEKKVKAQKVTEVVTAMRLYRRSTFESLRVARLRESGGLTEKALRDITVKEEALFEQVVTAEEKLEKLMSGAAYKRYMERYDRIFTAEEKRRKRRGRR